MKQRMRWAACLSAAVLMGATRASAQEVAAPASSFELGVSAGYAQGFGPAGGGVPRLQELGKAGGAVELDAGWRLAPSWLVGAYGEFGLFGSGDLPGSDHALSVAAGLQAQLHLAPGEQLDPWASLGFGWRGYWGELDHDARYGLQGLEGRLRVGLDYRLSQKFAAGPVAGLTLTEFVSEKAPGADGYSEISDKKLDTFVFAGVGGRFDL